MRKDDDPEAQNPLRMDNEETIDTTTELELNPGRTVKNKTNANCFRADQRICGEHRSPTPRNPRRNAFPRIAGR